MSFVSYLFVTLLALVTNLERCTLRRFCRFAAPCHVLLDNLGIDRSRRDQFLHVFRQLRRKGYLLVTRKDIARIETLGLAAVAEPGRFGIRLAHLVSLRLVSFSPLRFTRHQHQSLVRRVPPQHPQGYVARDQLGIYQIQISDAAAPDYRVVRAHRADADHRRRSVNAARLFQHLRVFAGLLVAESHEIVLELGARGRLGVHVTGVCLTAAHVTLGILVLREALRTRRSETLIDVLRELVGTRRRDCSVNTVLVKQTRRLPELRIVQGRCRVGAGRIRTAVLIILTMYKILSALRRRGLDATDHSVRHII